LIDHILNENEPDEYGTNWYALMQDIPQILCYKKFDINAFFHISAAEVLTIFQLSEEKKEENINTCNFERLLNTNQSGLS
jgi:hypothetical protein